MKDLVRIDKSREILFIGTISIVALATRIYGIWDWTIIGDEYFTVAFADERYKSFKNPAYYILVLGATNLFGLTEWSARLPSMLLGFLSVPVFYVACRHAVDRRTALIGSLLIIFSSWHLYHSQISRFYSGVFFFAILSYFFYYISLQRDSYLLLAGAFFANILGVLFHVTSVMVPAACMVYSAFILWMKPGRPAHSSRIATAHLAICGAGVLITLPFFWQIAYEWGTQGHALSTDPFHVLLDLAESVNPVLATSSVFGLLLMVRKDVPKGVFFMVGVGIPILALIIGSAVLPTIRAKYVFYILPLIIVLSGFLCTEVSSALSKYRVAKHAVAFLVVVSLMPGFVSHYTGRMSLDIRDPIQVIEREYEPGDKIVVFSPAIQYNFKEKFPDSAWQVVGSKSVWKGALRPLEDGGQRAWVLVDTYRSSRMREDLEAWLMKNASLVWRKNERRFDYSMRGYEIWMVNRSPQ